MGIVLNNVSKSYNLTHGSIEALSPTNLNIDEGNFVSIVGPSGCGKTTLLKIVGGLQRPSTGTVTIGGRPVEKPRSDVGFSFQSPVLLPWRSIIDNVLLPIAISQTVTRAHRERAELLLGRVGLSNFAGNNPSELSGGMQQRAALCRALINRPTCLLLDEPFGALDALTRESMNVLLNELWLSEMFTVILVTHSIQEAAFLSKRVLVMSARPGSVVDDISIELEDVRTLRLMSSDVFVRASDRIRSHFSSNADGVNP